MLNARSLHQLLIQLVSSIVNFFTLHAEQLGQFLHTANLITRLFCSDLLRLPWRFFSVTSLLLRTSLTMLPSKFHCAIQDRI
jgi:hypothetical protein